MNRFFSFAILTIAMLCQATQAQKLNKASKAVVVKLQAHVNYLADDKLEGRRAGTKGEELAASYIAKQFENNGITPLGDNNTYLQAFDIYEGKEFAKSSYLFINGEELPASEYFVFANSAQKMIEAAPAIALKEAAMPWFINLKEDIEQNAGNPHFDVFELVQTKVKDAVAKNASAVILYNTNGNTDILKYDGKLKADSFLIPVIYINNKAAKKYLDDETASLDIKLKTAFTNKNRTGHNVVAYINNNAAATILLGAHFDHLGFGEDDNSMYRVAAKLIHNGADDNASGTAVLIELADALKKSKLKKYNYAFVAFSAEELGLFGSKYFTDHPTVDLSKINYMVNMDMVGRLNDTSHALTIGGIGTSPEWTNVISSTADAKYFKIKYDSSGSGPSDHTSFYRKNIPVLFFFTGLHSDYHKPTDDADKINYHGQYLILKYIYNIIEATQNKPKLVFTKTKEQQMATNTRFTVTMGLMIDYAFSGNGVKLDGVSDGRPGQKAGLQAGDILVEIGGSTINSVEQYMKQLGKFKKGDTTTVKYKRGAQEQTASVTF
jgi:aminopeptidase YwaD